MRNSLLLLLIFFIVILPAKSQNADSSLVKYFFHYNKTPDSYWELLLTKLGISNELIGRSIALIVGVNYYPEFPNAGTSKCLKNLTPVKIDIIKLKEYLKNVENFDEIIVLENEHVNESNLSYFLQNYIPNRLKNNKNSRFLFAYSGHGYTANNKGYLLNSNARSCSDKSNSLQLTILKSYLEETILEAHRSLVLLNACYGGQLCSDGKVSLGESLTDKPGAHIITAGWDNELVYAKSRSEGSLFFEKVLEALYSSYNTDGIEALISTDEIYSYVLNEIRQEFNYMQNPRICDMYPEGGGGGHFYFMNRKKLEDLKLVRKWEDFKDWLKFGDSIYRLNEEYEIILKRDGQISNKQYTDPEEDPIATMSMLTTRPYFPRGNEYFSQYLRNNLKYPDKARRMGIEGTVFSQIVIEKDGSIKKVSILQGLGHGLDEEVKRVLTMSPPWIPGKIYNKSVRVSFVYPVSFSLGFENNYDYLQYNLYTKSKSIATSNRKNSMNELHDGKYWRSIDSKKELFELYYHSKDFKKLKPDIKNIFRNFYIAFLSYYNNKGSHPDQWHKVLKSYKTIKKQKGIKKLINRYERK